MSCHLLSLLTHENMFGDVCLRSAFISIQYENEPAGEKVVFNCTIGVCFYYSHGWVIDEL